MSIAMRQYTLAIAVAMLATGLCQARSLDVQCGAVTYSYPEEQTGLMTFTAGTDLEIAGRTFPVSSVTRVSVAEETMADNLVLVDYDGAQATVTVAGNVARYLEVSVSGADVSIVQSAEVGDDTCGEITYRLAGASDDGSFHLDGSYKASIELNGLDLTSLSGAPLDIQDGKRIAVRVAEGTANRLSDAPGGSQKGALVCKGHLEFKHNGSLTVSGHTAHAIYAKEYVELKNANITVDHAVKDGLNCNQYFLMESGSLTISGTGDDGVQVAFKDDTDREAEDTGSITVKGGTIEIAVTATACKGLKADGEFVQTGGDIKVTNSAGGKWSAADAKTKAASCISADGGITISGGYMDLKATGGGGKGLNSDGLTTVTGGELTIRTSGGLFAYVNGKEYDDYTGNADRLDSDYKSSPKGIKSDGGVLISGGSLDIVTTGTNAEGIESKTSLTIEDGTVKVRAYDDAINSAGDMYIKGGVVDVISTKNDGLDSNGNMYISGGLVMAFGAGSPECGIDVNDEYGYKLYVTGGCVLGVGGRNSTPVSGGQAYLLPSVSVKAGALTVKSGDDELYTFEVPADYSGSTSGGRANAPGGWPGGGPGGMGGGGVLVSLPALQSGASYTVTTTAGTANATAR